MLKMILVINIILLFLLYVSQFLHAVFPSQLKVIFLSGLCNYYFIKETNCLADYKEIEHKIKSIDLSNISTLSNFPRFKLKLFVLKKMDSVFPAMLIPLSLNTPQKSNFLLAAPPDLHKKNKNKTTDNVISFI